MSLLRYVAFLIVGIFFGIAGTKGEFISWFRIQEMFRFQSFHMYGIIGTAVVTGIIMTRLFKWFNFKNIDGHDPVYSRHKSGFWHYLLGGIIFGVGWALVGSCPGPVYILIGNGYGMFLLVFVMAVVGTFLYGLVREKLPH